MGCPEFEVCPGGIPCVSNPPDAIFLHCRGIIGINRMRSLDAAGRYCLTPQGNPQLSTTLVGWSENRWLLFDVWDVSWGVGRYNGTGIEPVRTPLPLSHCNPLPSTWLKFTGYSQPRHQTYTLSFLPFKPTVSTPPQCTVQRATPRS